MSELFELAPQRDFIDGTWQELSMDRVDSGGSTLWIEHASTGQPVVPQRASTPERVEAALLAAQRLHDSGEWAHTSAAERAEVLDSIAADLQQRIPHVAGCETAESGAALATTSMLGFIVHAAFSLAAEQLRQGVLTQRFDGPHGDVEVSRLPFGPGLLLCPWNAPAPMAAHKVASALAAGAPAILKPPERAPHGCEAFGEAADALGLPAGLIQIVQGGPEVAAALMNDDRVSAVSFTGGIVGGRAVAHACAQGLKPVQLELGGLAPLVVLDDADPLNVAQAAVGLLTTLNGQWCRALGRLMLPRQRAGEFLDAIVAALTDVVIGDPFLATTQMGPMVHSEHLKVVHAAIDHLRAQGGSLIAPTPVPAESGNWLAPTLVTGVESSLACDEIFGPVATVHEYGSDAEAVALANQTRYGLEAYVVGSDTDRALDVARQIRAGGVKVNGVSPMSLNLMAPRPAFGLSGLGEEGTLETMWFFAGNQVVGIEGSLGAS